MRGALAGVVVAMATLLWIASPASAHGDDPVFDVEAHPSAGSVHYVVRVTWENDGHPIDGKTLTATPTDPAGAAGTPVTLSWTSDGRYEGDDDSDTSAALMFDAMSRR